MSKSPRTREEKLEDVPLTIMGAAARQNRYATSSRWCRCDDPHHRKLAICSIICGITCIGISALTNSVEAEREEDPERAAAFTRRAKKFGIISIVVWVSVLILTPILFMLVSYLITLGD
uniref:Si:dkey-16l2.20 n=1 Tax=Gasterosteus aculeatus TaxID=69293 RepID=G3PK73_GASAC|nr:transmembrane protein 265-like [Gasterosteus aculeatus aculeatus]XP_040046453.1 transmembrane protein 265-like [Gasterosteus aculeatus aculeatus]